MKEIENINDIKCFVNAFYTKVQNDELLAPIFASKIPDGAWDKHLNRMYDFWGTVLLGEKKYRGNPFSKHAMLPIQGKHFDHWIQLFTETIDAHFQGDKATEAKERAAKMALLFSSKLEYIRNHPQMKSII